MNYTIKRKALAFILIFLSFFACEKSSQKDLLNKAQRIIGVTSEIPIDVVKNRDLIELGRKLYLDPALSANDTVSCNSCHNIENNGSGTDNKRVSTGINGQQGGRNAPTVLNSAFFFAQFWDGRAENLEQQAKGPILNPLEMGMPNAGAVENKLRKKTEYLPLFAKSFGDPGITFDRIAIAIAAFEKTLITTDRFDDFMQGNVNALDLEEAKGLEIFLNTGCISCHNGAQLGGRFFRKIGIVNPYPNTKDKGLYEITKNEDDLYLFKVPSLRNVARTAPYFHDGGAPTLDNAVRQMGWMQLGRDLSEYEVYYIVKFLESLSGKVKTGEKK